MKDNDIFDKILKGLVSNQTNMSDIAQAIHRNIVFFSSIPVPGLKRKKEEDQSLGILTLFEDLEDHKKIAEVACRYHLQTSSFVDPDILKQVLKSRGLEAKELTSIMFLFDSLSKEEVEEAAFKFWVREVVDFAKSVTLAEALANGMQALETQYVDSKTSIIYKGPEAALELVDEARAIPGMTDQNILSMPSGDIRTEYREVIYESEQASTGEKPPGVVYSGFRFVDEQTNGHYPGDTILVGAHTGEGKSQYSANVAWHACVEQGKNVLVVTLETARAQYRRRVYCRHSNKPDVGRIGGILYNSIKTGQFKDKAEAELWVKVSEDFGTNPSYGIFDIAQATEGMTMTEVAIKAKNFEDKYGVQLHMIIVDYLALMGVTRSRQKRQEELNDILIEAKGFATSYDNGRGIILLAPHQTKQARREIVKPENGKFYTVRDYADTSEAGKTIDVGIMLLRTTELEEVHEIAASLVKCRDSEAPPTVTRLYERYATSFIGNMSAD